MTTPLLTRQDGDVRWLRLNRPHRRNALDPALISALDAGIADAMRDQGTSIVVIAGEGPSFCAGADLEYLRALADNAHDPLPFLTDISDCFTHIEQSLKPTVAVLHGHAVAGGLELALACDVVVASTDTLIGDGHIRNGLLPAGGSSVRLPRKVGEPLARWLILTGQLLSAEAFLGSGFLHAIAGPGHLDETVAEVLSTLRANAGSSQLNGKRLLTNQVQLDQHAGLRTELEAFAHNWQSSHMPAALAKFAARPRER